MQLYPNDTIVELFRYQARECEIYRAYLSHLGCKVDEVKAVADIPFLPIDFFKTHDVKTGIWPEEHVFQSSGTTAAVRSKHFVHSMQFYLSNAQRIFEDQYRSANEMAILALLPGYAPESSLVAMANQLINASHFEESAFYSDGDYSAILKAMESCRLNKTPTILLGVTFSLLDFASSHHFDFPELIVIETGGMKGRRKEMTRKEVHAALKEAFHVDYVHSEYGMTELLSQAYSMRDGLFEMNDTFYVVPGDIYDPLAVGEFNQTARLNIIDLANEKTCAFIATSDLGRVYEDMTFEVLGRMDNSDIRGCNLLYA